MKMIFLRCIAFVICCTLMVGSATTQVHANNFFEVKNPQTGRMFVFNDTAISNLQKLKNILRENNLQQHTETLQAIMMVETQAGVGGSIGLPNAHPSFRSYGLMQVTVPTARTILRDHADLRYMFFPNKDVKQISNNDIQALLLKNQTANIMIGVRVFVQYLEMVNGEWSRAVAAYNMGIGNALKRTGAPASPYVTKVRSWMPILSTVNREILDKTNRVEVDTSMIISRLFVDLFEIKTEDDTTLDQQKENNNGKQKVTVNFITDDKR